MSLITLAKKDGADLGILSKMANRHGLIAGATGTGKSVSLKILAEKFSNLGVPVFLSDVKGDLSGLAKAGKMSDKLQARLTDLKLPAPDFAASPVLFWDVFGDKGHPVRTTISEMGPIILSQLMGLNDTQEGVLTIAFRVADDQGMLLLDLKDLRSMLQFVYDNRDDFKAEYGNIHPASVGAIQRGLLQLEEQGADLFFGEPALSLGDFMQTDADGRGYINILDAQKLMLSPKLYACFLLWMLSELFETLPEVGDPEKPKFVFFFDEAHLLFDGISDVLQDKIEQVVRLIRSKGVGIYFITQSPSDLPEAVLGQLGNRIQHALRAFTPKDQKAVRVAAQTFRQNDSFDTSDAITQLGVGEALISTLDEKGAPSVVERAWMLAPASAFKPIDDALRDSIIKHSIVGDAYDVAVDRESAYEMLQSKAEERLKEEAEAERLAELEKIKEAEEKERLKEEERKKRAEAREAEQKARARAKLVDRVVGNFASSAARSLGTKAGRSLLRGVLGSILGR